VSSGLARGQRAFAIAVAATSWFGCAGFREELRAGNALPGSADERSTVPRDPSRVAFDMRFRIQLQAAGEGAYVPLERAPVALDPINGRIYAATNRGEFFAYAADGTRMYRRSFGDAIDAGIAVDPVRDRVYVGTSRGRVHELSGATGEPIWTVDAGQPLTGSPVLTDDTLFVVADSDVVLALSREDGTVLWSYRRPPTEEITITGHAGLALHGDALLAAFNDGMVAGIRASDGSVLWEIDTSVDLEASSTGLPRMRDVDTTPVVVGGSIFVASFAAGIYQLDANNGTVLHRDETWTGVTAILGLPNGDLFVASADRGLARIDPIAHTVAWSRPLDRGAPTGATYEPDTQSILFGESRGSLIAVRAESGDEVARFESGYGFGAPATAADGVVAALSNTATLFVFVAR